MEVILLEKVNRLGVMGDVVSVKAGFARNFLIPTGKAIRATKENIQYFEEQKAHLSKKDKEKKAKAEAIAKQLPNSVMLIRQAGDDGKLFGSVNARDIANEINNVANLSINKTQVLLSDVVKFIGVAKAQVVLHPEVAVEIQVMIARSPEEAEALNTQEKSEDTSNATSE